MAEPRFDEVIVEDGLSDGYWIQAVDIDGDGRPDILTSGLADGVVAWYQNPDWRKRTIHSFSRPVALDQGDIAGEGRRDLVVCHDYAPTMFEATPADGRISWLRNPGRFDDGDGEWEVREIGQLGSTHRLRLGRFSGTGTELLALPVVGPKSGMEALHYPIRVVLYRRPDDVLGADSWEAELLDEQSFRVIHAAGLGHYGPPGSDDRHAALIASEEGLTWFGTDDDGSWRTELLGRGETEQADDTGYRGSANVAVGRIGDDPFAYIAALEPFHGNTLALYTPDGAEGGLTERSWTRHVIDRYGEPNESGEGPAHHVVTADFDGDGDDEFLVALRGPEPHQGVFHYKLSGTREPTFEKVRVSTPSAARIAVADFDGDGRLDFATIGYYVPGYFLCDDPQLSLYLNRYGEPVPGQPTIPPGPLGG